MNGFGIQKKIVYIEEENGAIQAFEFKRNERKAHVKKPESLAKAYPDAIFHVITPKNMEEFLLI